jgi:hypothetical protein
VLQLAGSCCSTSGPQHVCKRFEVTLGNHKEAKQGGDMWARSDEVWEGACMHVWGGSRQGRGCVGISACQGERGNAAASNFQANCKCMTAGHVVQAPPCKC